MYWTVLTAVIALASPAPPASQGLLVSDFVPSAEVDPDVARTLTDIVTVEMARDSSFQVMSGEDIRNLVALEGEKQMIGCDVNASCLAELAGVMGARFVVFGRLSTLDRIFVLHLNLMDASTGTALSRVVIEAESVSQFTPKLRTAAETMLHEVHALLQREEAARRGDVVDVTPNVGEGELSPLAMGLYGAGALVAILGGVALVGTLAVMAIAAPTLWNPESDLALREPSQLAFQIALVGSPFAIVAVVIGGALVGAGALIE